MRRFLEANQTIPNGPAGTYLFGTLPLDTLEIALDREGSLGKDHSG